MKLISELKINYILFIDNFNQLKKIKINILSISPFIGRTSDYYQTHLDSNEVFKNQEKIKKFLSNNTIDDADNIPDYKFFYINIQYSYLMYLYKEKKLDFNDDILLRSNRFMFFLITKHSNEVNSEKIKDFEKGFLKNEEYSYKYATEILRKPWKELEESNFYFNPKSVDLKLEYLKKCVIGNINLKGTNKHYIYITLDYLMNNPTYKKDLDLLLASKNLLEWTLKDLFQFHYLKELDEYILKNHPKNYGLFYYFLYNSYFNQKLETYNLNEVMKRVCEVPAALFSVFQRFQNDKKLINEFLENSEVINKNMLKDLKTLVLFLNFISIKKQKYFFDFMDNNLNIIDDIFKVIDDDSTLSEFMRGVGAYYSQDIKDDDIFSDAKSKRFKEVFEQKFPQVIKKISQYSKSALSYVINTREQFIEGEEAIFKEPLFKQEYLKMLKKLGPKKIKNYNSYDFSEIK
jgi:hypothetical protein